VVLHPADVDLPQRDSGSVACLPGCPVSGRSIPRGEALAGLFGSDFVAMLVFAASLADPSVPSHPL
jgi:hypothetical protein